MVQKGAEKGKNHFNQEREEGLPFMAGRAGEDLREQVEKRLRLALGGRKNPWG